MLGSPVKQSNRVDSAFANRKKRSRVEMHLQKIDELIDPPGSGEKIEASYKQTRKQRLFWP